jgi:hypothetical protein
MRRFTRLAGVVLALLAVATGFVWLAGMGSFGRFDSELGQPAAPPRSAGAVARERERQSAVLPGRGAKQILFGDLHVHTTISFDAFMLNLPIMGGQGAHPPADACDFARHCSALDFWSINDHAENIHPDDWRATIDSIRQCNALAGDAADPDVVAFLGWEWTQAGLTPEDHYGHKNVVLASIEEADIPTRPISASAGGTAAQPPGVWARGALALGGTRFHDLARRWTALGGLEACADAPVRELPADCREIAATPADLFRKLDDWGFESIVIPHGTSWGIYTPAGASWDKQLTGSMHDPRRQKLIEVYSGHGESEVYREWRAVLRGVDGSPICPEEQPDYLPMCRRAGQIVRERCLAEGSSDDECERRAEEARRLALEAGVSPHVTVPGASAPDWLDAGQCRDCDRPAFNYRPASSAQYIAAITRFDAARPRRFRLGFMASSDIHSARPGTGYKEVSRKTMTDAGQEHPRDGVIASFFTGPPEPPVSRSRSIGEARKKLRGLQLFETERSQSFLYTGGLVAVHAEARNRAAIWAALERREVYGTSGPRILLSFDLLPAEPEAVPVPMGGEIETRGSPRFRAAAVGSFEQQPGCPDEARRALGDEGIDRLCAGECYNPGDVRRPITRIEVIRIRPQVYAGEDVAELIEDPWLRFDCRPDPAGCRFDFDDPDFPDAQRDTLYYVRAFEPETATINGATLRCSTDAEGRCLESHPCPPGQECLAAYEPRAWSSPIYVDFARP